MLLIGLPVVNELNDSTSTGRKIKKKQQPTQEVVLLGALM